MKPFAIKINSEQEYKKVKKYAEKWGYKHHGKIRYDQGHEYVWFEGYVFNSCHTAGSEYNSSAFNLTSNWRKHIRKNTPLTAVQMSEKQLRKFSGVKRKNELGESISVASLHEKLSDVEKRIEKLEQKELISQMMQDDEADGLYPPLTPKIAIRVENEQEFKKLMRIYESLGWVNADDRNPTSMNYYYEDSVMKNLCISFHNKFVYAHDEVWSQFRPREYIVIPFSTIKGLK